MNWNYEVLQAFKIIRMHYQLLENFWVFKINQARL